MKQFVLATSISGQTTVELRGDDYHYLVHVRRLSTGDRFTALDAGGRKFRCTIREITSSSCTIALEAGNSGTNDDPASLDIILFQCLPKGSKFDQIVRQATECGVRAIVPVQSRHAVPHIPGDRMETRLDRWRRVAKEAVQQSGGRIPELLPPIGVEDISRTAETLGLRFRDAENEPGHSDRREAGVTGLVFHQDRMETSVPIGRLPSCSGTVAVCIGPEGGFADEEIDILDTAGFITMYLGERILRTETAAVYAIAAVQSVTAVYASENAPPTSIRGTR